MTPGKTQQKARIAIPVEYQQHSGGSLDAFAGKIVGQLDNIVGKGRDDCFLGDFAFFGKIERPVG